MALPSPLLRVREHVLAAPVEGTGALAYVSCVSEIEVMMNLRTALPAACLAVMLAGVTAASSAPWMDPDPIEPVPLVAPVPTPPAMPVAQPRLQPPPTIEIIRWKKTPVRRPKRADYMAASQTFNAVVAGTQSATLQWSIDVDAEPGRCNRHSEATVVTFASTRPVLVSAAPRSSLSITSLPVTINFATSASYNPDFDSCFSPQPNSSCRLDGQSLPGTATFATRGNGKVTRSLYLQRLDVDTSKAGASCVGGLFGYPEILGLDSGSENAAIPWAAVGSRSRQNVSISKVYGTQGDQTQDVNTCTHEGSYWVCAFASRTEWRLTLLRAPQVRIPGWR